MWNYRIIEQYNGVICLAEVFYENGEPKGSFYTDFSCFETVQQLENALHLALGALHKPVLKVGVNGELKEKV